VAPAARARESSTSSSRCSPCRTSRATRADIQRNAELIAKMIEKRGIAAKLVSVPGGNPIVVGSIRTPGATRTIGFYAHYDGQPLDPKEWASPPFEPALRDSRDGRGRQGDSLTGRRNAVRSGVPPVCARGCRRQGVDCRHPVRDRCRPRRGSPDEIEHHASRSRARKRRARRTSRRRSPPTRSLFAADPWLIFDGPVYQTRQQIGDLWRPRHHVVRRDGVRRADRVAQRPVRQLGAEPGDGARAAADVDEGRQRPRPDPPASTTRSRRSARWNSAASRRRPMSMRSSGAISGLAQPTNRRRPCTSC